jgi:PD-(D/E)XK endonuclease
MNAQAPLTGLAGEYLVCSDILSQGRHAFPVTGPFAYDVAIATSSRLLRIQVKTVTQCSVVGAPKLPVWRFSVQRGRGGRKVERYGEEEFDLLALVALDIRKVGYMLSFGGQWRKSVRSLNYTHLEGDFCRQPGVYIEHLTLQKALADLGVV